MKKSPYANSIWKLYQTGPFITTDEIYPIINAYENTREWKDSLKSILDSLFAFEESWQIFANFIANKEETSRHFGLFMLHIMVKHQWPEISPGTREDIKSILVEFAYALRGENEYDPKSLDYWGNIALEITKHDPSFLKSSFFENAIALLVNGKTCYAGVIVLKVYLKGLQLAENMLADNKKELEIKVEPLFPRMLQVIKDHLNYVIDFSEIQTKSRNQKLAPKRLGMDTTNTMNCDSVENIQDTYEGIKELLDFLYSCFEWASLNYLDIDLVLKLQKLANLPFDATENQLPFWELKQKMILSAVDCLKIFLRTHSPDKVNTQLIKGTLQIFYKMPCFFVSESKGFTSFYRLKILQCVEMMLTNHSPMIESDISVHEFIHCLSMLKLQDSDDYNVYLCLWLLFLKHFLVKKGPALVNEICGDSIKMFVFDLYHSFQLKNNRVAFEKILSQGEFAKMREHWNPIQNKCIMIIEHAASVYTEEIILQIFDDLEGVTEGILKFTGIKAANSPKVVFDYTDLNCQEHLMFLTDASTLLTSFGRLVDCHDEKKFNILWSERVYNKFSSIVQLAEYFGKWNQTHPQKADYKLFKIPAFETEIVLLEVLIKSIPWISKVNTRCPKLRNRRNHVSLLTMAAFDILKNAQQPLIIIDLAQLLLDSICRHFDVTEEFELFNEFIDIFCNPCLLHLPFNKQIIYLRILQNYGILTKRHYHRDYEYLRLVKFISGSDSLLRSGAFNSRANSYLWFMDHLSVQIEYAHDLEKVDIAYVAKSLAPAFLHCIKLCNYKELEKEVLPHLMKVFEIMFAIMNAYVNPIIRKTIANSLLFRFQSHEAFYELIADEAGEATLANMTNAFTKMIGTEWFEGHFKYIVQITARSAKHFSSKGKDSELKKALIEFHCGILIKYFNWFYGNDNIMYLINIILSFLTMLNEDDDKTVLLTVVKGLLKLNEICNLFQTVLFSGVYIPLFLSAIIGVLSSKKAPEVEPSCYEILYLFAKLNFDEFYNISLFNALKPTDFNQNGIQVLMKYAKVDEDLTSFSENFKNLVRDYTLYKHAEKKETNVEMIVEKYVADRQAE